MPTICLNMIVKNESKIITRLFETLQSVFDTYCICDTGSTDDTVSLIESWMSTHNKNGKIIREPFRNFGYNRTHGILEAQKLIQRGELNADYFLFLDADMKLVVSKKFDKSMLTANAYSIIQKSPSLSYYNIRFVKTSCNVRSVGVTHEYYDIPEGGVSKLDESYIYIDDVGDGGSKADKSARDIRLLTEGINDPATSNDLKGRYYFYLANTHFDSNQNDRAIELYKERIAIGGWIEEVWYSKYRIGLAYCRMGRKNDAVNAFLAAYQHHPRRAEPLYELVKMHRISGENNIAYMFYKTAKEIPYPKDDLLFINRSVYEYLLDYELSIIGYYVKHPSIDKLIINLLNNPSAGLDFRHMMSNYKFYSRNIRTEKVIDFTDHTIFNGFTSSTPCIVETETGYLLWVRHHNYDISNYGVSVLDKDLKEQRMYSIDNPADTGMRYTGIEDVKLFNFNNTLYFMGTAQCPDTGELRIAFGKRDHTSDRTRLEYHTVESPMNRKCEKNWAFFSSDDKELKIVYEWDNFKTYSVNTYTNYLCQNTLETLPTPQFFKYLRGSSNGVCDGDYIWFLCHLVNFEPHRSYYHVFVVYNYKTKKFTYTVPFKFEGKNVEYTLGMVIKGADVIVSYSTQYNTSKVAIINKKEICELLMGNSK